MAGHACAGNTGPYTSFTESSSFNLLGSYYSYDYLSFSSGSGFAYVWLYLRTPVTSTTLAISYGGKGFAAVMPSISPRTDSFYAGRLYIGPGYFTIQPTVRFAVDPTTVYTAIQASSSANLQVRTGIETTVAYSQRIISLFAPWDATLSGKVQDVFVDGGSSASSSSSSAAVRGHFGFRDDGANLTFRVGMGNFQLIYVSWAKTPAAIAAVSW